MSTTTNENRTPRQAQLELIALVDDVQHAAGGAWENDDSPSPVGCQLPPSAIGVAYTAARRTPVALAEGAVAAVLHLLGERGFQAGRRDAPGYVSVLGVHPANPAFTVELRVFANTAAIVGQSACVPGEVWDELQRVSGEASAAVGL